MGWLVWCARAKRCGNSSTADSTSQMRMLPAATAMRRLPARHTAAAVRSATTVHMLLRPVCVGLTKHVVLCFCECVACAVVQAAAVLEMWTEHEHKVVSRHLQQRPSHAVSNRSAAVPHGASHMRNPSGLRTVRAAVMLGRARAHLVVLLVCCCCLHCHWQALEFAHERHLAFQLLLHGPSHLQTHKHTDSRSGRRQWVGKGLPPGPWEVLATTCLAVHVRRQPTGEWQTHRNKAYLEQQSDAAPDEKVWEHIQLNKPHLHRTCC